MSAPAILATVHGLGEAAEKLGVIAVAALAAVVLLSGPHARRPFAGPSRISERARAAAMLAVLVLTPVLLTVDIWHTSQLTHLRHHLAKAGAAAVLGLAVVVALAAVIHRSPQAFGVLVVFALPFRLPISTGAGPRTC